MQNFFPNSLKEAKALQIKVAREIKIDDEFEKLNLISALDIAYKEEKAFTAAVVYEIKTKKIVEKKVLETTPTFEYVSGYLFLREVPAFLEILDLLENQPDLIVVDGHGIAHPLNAGSATVLGYLIDKPVIGVAKNPMKMFEYSNSRIKKELIIDDVMIKGKVVGNRISYPPEKKWRPIFVSPGNKISISSALNFVVKLLEPDYKLPKPLFFAHLLSKEYIH